MAVLANLGQGTKFAVDFTTRIGRARDSQLVLEQSHVSSHHAVIRWTSRGWLLRDLGSTNGTFIDGERISPGEDHMLDVGRKLGFGRPEGDWLVLDVHEPRTCAIPVDDDGDAVYSQGGILALPDPSNPQITLFSGRDGHWLMETEAGTHAVNDGAVFEVAGRRFRLRTPEAATGTTEIRLSRMPQLVRSLELRFQFHDDTLLGVWAGKGAQARELDGGDYQHLLALLASSRLRDSVADGEGENCGWVSIDEVSQRLQIDATQLKIVIFAARKVFGEFGVSDPAAIIERRPQTRSLRIGVPATGLSGL